MADIYAMPEGMPDTNGEGFLQPGSDTLIRTARFSASCWGAESIGPDVARAECWGFARLSFVTGAGKRDCGYLQNRWTVIPAAWQETTGNGHSLVQGRHCFWGAFCTRKMSVRLKRNSCFRRRRSRR